jgi:hypothetical protein
MKFKNKLIKFIFICLSMIIISGVSSLYAASTSSSTFTCEAIVTWVSSPTVVNVQSVSNIEMLRNNLDIVVIIRSNANINSAQIHYGMSSDTTTWKIKDCDSKTNLGGEMWQLTFTIPGDEINSVGDIRYYINVYDSDYVFNVYPNNEPPSLRVPLSTNTYTAVPVTNFKIQAFSSGGGKMTIFDGNPLDGENYIDFPAGCMGNGTSIIMIQKSNDDTKDAPNGQGDMLSRRPVTLYSIGEGANASHITFTKPVTVCLLYRDLDNDGNLDDCADFKDERYLKAFYYDGYDWRLIGGTVDAVNNTVTFKTTHFSTYALFPTRLTADMYRPKERIITPALKDGYNDYAIFDGLNDEGSKIKIYDVLGRLVRTISDIPYEWDGKDEYGNIVENGVYIYQFKADVEGKKKLISGTIAVAK